jgi:hypothetical protein
MRHLESLESRSLFASTGVTTITPVPVPTTAVSVPVVSVVGTYAGTSVSATGLQRAWVLKITLQSGSDFSGTLTLRNPLSATAANIDFATFAIAGKVGPGGAITAAGKAIAGTGTLKTPADIGFTGNRSSTGAIDGNYKLAIYPPPGSLAPVVLEQGKFHVQKLLASTTNPLA